jgi:hypothetical protein
VSEHGGPAGAERAQRLVVDLGAAFQHRATYTAGHPELQRTIGRVLDDLGALCERNGTTEVSLLILEGTLLVDREALPDDARWRRGLMRALERNGIQGMTLSAGLDAAELGAFLDGCAAGGRPVPSRHIRIGQAGLAGEAAPGPGASVPAGVNSTAPDPMEGVEGAAEEWRALAGGAVTRIERLRALVARLARGAEPLAEASLRRAATRVADRELIHGLSVSLATLRLGRALGVTGPALEDLALAGLLHDVGYLDPAGEHQDLEWRRTQHPLLGAARLAGLEGIPDVAVLVALEHHRRVDGGRGRAEAAISPPPAPATRVVAVADTWVTLRGPARATAAVALAALRRRAGTWLDPALVEVFATRVEPPPP